MEKIELLSPVGEVKNFYTAIKSGADAVYLGLPRFNARMRAENISLDNLPHLVSFAHLKNVKVYVVINILLSTNEFKEMIALIGECLKAKVDGFIVQDYGVIGILKEVYPDIVLHGSTQMGVHNIRGAKVAKRLGLSRVVLSREVTLKDIEEIANNVDIELEVFIQGAMCVAFSGNCYMSSIKCGASGNRGECKQLCRLPYTLTDNKNSLTGYAISPRDNCMLKYLDKLISLGVKSLKIEGRLRNDNYISVATGVYRNAIDEIYNEGKINNIQDKTTRLKEVFSRGDYTTGYIESNNIINPKENNHLGKKIGKVISCIKFKDIYKITILTQEKLNSGDGLKFVFKNEIISIGVGNVELDANKCIVYGNKYIHNESEVYLSKTQEENVQDNSKHRHLNISFEGLVGNKSKITLSCDGFEVYEYGEVVDKGKTKITDEETIIAQINKIDKEIFVIDNINVIIDEGYISLSEINSLRRNAIDKLIEIVNIRDVVKKEKELNSVTTESLNSRYSRVAVVDEKFDFSKDYDAIIFSPDVYSLDSISLFKKKHSKHYKTPLIINLPIIARSEDLKIIDKLVYSNLDCEFIANNIYALDYIFDGIKVWAGSGLNLSNIYSAHYLNKLGVIECVSSIEKWSQTLTGSYKMSSGNMMLMTFVHCPVKTLYNNDCKSCKYSGVMKLSSNNNYKIRRIKISDCYFELIDDVNIDYKYSNQIFDLR